MFWSACATGGVMVSCASYEGDVTLNVTHGRYWWDHVWPRRNLLATQRLDTRESKENGKKDTAYQVMRVGVSPL